MRREHPAGENHIKRTPAEGTAECAHQCPLSCMASPCQRDSPPRKRSYSVTALPPSGLSSWHSQPKRADAHSREGLLGRWLCLPALSPNELMALWGSIHEHEPCLPRCPARRLTVCCDSLLNFRNAHWKCE
jgi:hypothetical protein